MFNKWIDMVKEDFIEGMESDLYTQSYTRRMVRFVSGHDYVGELDSLRKLMFTKVELSEDVVQKLKDMGAW